MSDILENCTIRILNIDLDTVGTGFIVNTGGLAVTCNHVVLDAIRETFQQVNVQLYKSGQNYKANVLEKFRSERDEYDVVFLQLVNIQTPLPFAPLGTCADTYERYFRSLGFPAMEDQRAFIAHGHVRGLIRTKEKLLPLLQLEGEEMERGMSGSAIYDVRGSRVIGMMIEYINQERTRSAYAVTVDILFEVCPELEADIFYGCVYRAQMVLTDLRNFQTNSVANSIGDDVALIAELSGRFDDLATDLSGYWIKYTDATYKMTIESILGQAKSGLDNLESIIVRSNLLYKHKNYPFAIRQEINKLLQFTLGTIGQFVELLHAVSIG